MWVRKRRPDTSGRFKFILSMAILRVLRLPPQLHMSFDGETTSRHRALNLRAVSTSRVFAAGHIDRIRYTYNYGKF